MSQSNTPFHLSPAVREHLTPSPTLAINEQVGRMWAEGETVYHLGFGESRFPVHPKIQEALRVNVHQKSYLAGQGLLELREMAAQFYSRRLKLDISPDQVIIGPGSKSLIFAVQMALDATLILPTPSWVSYEPQAHLLAKPVQRIQGSPADGYALSLDALADAVQQVESENKILLITSPDNPTGKMYDERFLRHLADFCRAHGIVVISDEIYALLSHAPNQHISVARYYPEGTVVLSGLSKHLSLGGWRIGVGIAPDSEEGRLLMAALRVVASEIWSTPTGPIQYAAVLAFSEDPDVVAYIDECRRIHTIRTQYLWRELAATGAACAQPQGAFYLFPNFDRWRDPLAARGVHTSADLAHHLLREHQLATLPGSAFGAPPEDLSLRLASSYLDMENDEKAQAILDAYRANPDPDVFIRDHHPAMQEAARRFHVFVDSLA